MSKEKSSNSTGEAQLRHLFDSCQKSFFENEYSSVKQELEKSLSSFPSFTRLTLIRVLRKLCKTLNVSTRVATTSDIERIILGASYWSYCIREYAMNMGSMESFKESIWKEVEDISKLTIDEITKISSHFEANNS